MATPIVPNSYVAAWPGELVDVDQRTMFVRHAPPTCPDPEPAVFIHGLGGSATNWTELMDLLRDELDGIAVDLPGFGQSPPPPDGDYSPKAHAHAVATLVRQRFGDRRVHVFGNSLGGATALQLAAHFPELVRSLTLISPALPDRVPRRTNIHMPVVAVPRLGEGLTKQVMKRSTEWRINASLDISFSNPKRINPQRYADMVEEADSRNAYDYTTAAMLASLRGLMATYFDRSGQRPWKLAESITVPVVLIYGRDDKLVNPKVAFKVTKVFPNARVVILSDSGHLSQVEQPELVAEAWRQLRH